MSDSLPKDQSNRADSPGVDLEGDTEKASVTRRAFIRNAAAGVAGAAFALHSSADVIAASKESGIITLDAVLFTYMSATIGAIGGSKWTLNDLYATTLRLGSVENPGLSFRAQVPSAEGKIFIGHNARQTESSLVEGGITIRHSGFNGVTLAHGIGGGPAGSGDTQLYGMLKPRLQVKGNSRKLKFRFIDAQSEFLLSIDDIRKNIFGISQETSDSWLQHYVTEKAELTSPRFKLKTSTGFSGPATESVLKVSEKGDRDFSEARTALVTARIIDQTGFSSDTLRQTFAIGNHIEITHTSVQEFPTDDVIKMETTLERVTPGVSEIYWDRVFKNFLIIDANQL